MPIPQQFPRDHVGEPAKLLLKKHTDDLFAFLEALAMGKVTVTPSGRGTGKVLATPKHWMLSLDLVTPTWGATVSVTVAPLGQYLFSISAPELPDKTPLSVDMGATHDSQIIQGGAYVSGGSIYVQFYNTDPAVTRTLNGFVTVSTHP